MLHDPGRRLHLNHVDVDDPFVRIPGTFACCAVKRPARFALSPTLASMEAGGVRVESCARLDERFGLHRRVDGPFVPVNMNLTISFERLFIEIGVQGCQNTERPP